MLRSTLRDKQTVGSIEMRVHAASQPLQSTNSVLLLPNKNTIIVGVFLVVYPGIAGVFSMNVVWDFINMN